MDTINSNILFFSILPSSILPAAKEKEKDIYKCKCKLSPKFDKLSTPNNEVPQQSAPLVPSLISFQGYNFKVDIKSWEADLRYLASLNRYAKTHDSQIHQAGKWLQKRFQSIKNISVETQSVLVKDTYESYNIIGTLKGTTHPDTCYVIGAHYDSTSENPKVAAPGGLDNASGSAAVLEMARIFSETTFPFTIVFILFTGEEQGFYGSKKYVQQMFINDTIPSFMLNMDMISLDPEIIIETREELVAGIWEKLALKHSLKPKVDFNIWGSDHVTFANAGVPSILTCSDHSKYPHYHRTTDVPDNLHITSGYNTIVMNVQGFIAQMKSAIKYL